MKKRMMGLLLAAAMVFEGITATPVTAWADETEVNTNTSMETAEELTLEQGTEVTIGEGEEVYYQFTPSESGYYTFYSESEIDPIAELYDADESCLASNDDSFGEWDFSISYNLEAGQSYYLKVWMPDDREGGSITVNVKKSTFYAFADNESVTVGYGTKETLSVTAYSASGTLRYQWYYVGAEYVEVIIDDATGSSYEVNGTIDMARTYICKVTAGVETETCWFNLTLDTGLELEETDVYVKVPYGEKKTLTVEASGGAGELGYKWYYYDDEEGYVPIDGATGSRYTVDTAQNTATTYKCEVTDGFEIKTCWYYLTLDTGLTIQTESFEVVIPEGMTKELSVTASSVLEELTYQWYSYDEEEEDYIRIPGATKATYSVEGNAQGPKQYRVEVSDGVVTESLHISVVVVPVSEFEFEGNNILSNEDFATTEEVAFKIIPTEDCAYRFYSESTDGGDPYARLLDSQLNELESANNENGLEFSLEYALKEGKTYYLIIGKYEINGTYTIKADELEFTASAKGNTNVKLTWGNTATLEVEAYSANGSLTYQWYDYDKTTDERIAIADATESSLEIMGNEKTSSKYACEVTDGTNTESVTFWIQIDTGLKVTKEYENTVMVPYGGTEILSVTASGGVGDYSYQWSYYDENEGEEVLIKDATGSSYEVTGEKGMPLEYRCEVSDGCMEVVESFTVELDTGMEVDANEGGRSLEYGEIFTFYARATGGAGAISYQWYYCYDDDDEGDVPIEGATGSDFQIVARADGSYRCKITDGIATKTYDFDFWVDSQGATDLAEVAAVTLGATSYTYDGTAKTPAVTVTDKGVALYAGKDYTVAYSNNTNVGTATVTITGKGVYTGTITKTFAIQAVSIANAAVTLGATSYTYDGTAKKPAVTVKLGNKVLVNGTDYTVAYSNNTNVGTATVAITGKGIYAGTVTKTFTIVKPVVDQGKEPEKKPVDISKAQVKLSKTSYYYDGKTKKPAVTVTVGGKKLATGDYTVSYKNNKNIGTATVTITGKGNYTGTVKKTFKITVKKGATYTVGSYKYKITGSSTVAFAGLKSTKTTKVTISSTVKIGGKSFKVTSIADKALYKKSKVTSVTIGTNVTTIGKEAFRSCSKLSKITIKTTKLKSVGKNALKSIKSTAKIIVPSKKLSAYKKLLKGKGQSSKVIIQK